MANQWFRMYAEFANDPKVQMLSETDQRRYIMLLCIRCNGDVTLHETEVAFQLRISNEEWLQTKAVLSSKNLITDDNQPTAWDKRQFASDSSAARVSKHREAKKQACNVTVTPQIQIQNRIDTEDKSTSLVAALPVSSPKKSKVSDYSDDFLRAWAEYPSRPGANKATAFKAWNARLAAGVDVETMISGVKRYSRYCETQVSSPEYIKHPATFFGPDRHYESDWQVIGGHNQPRMTQHQLQQAAVAKSLFGESPMPGGFVERLIEGEVIHD